MQVNLEVKAFQIEELKVEVFPTRQMSGLAAATDIAEVMRKIINEKKRLRMIFAAAPSQNELLSELIQIENVDWTKVTAFHMDEYVGLKSDAPQSFGQFLRERIFDKVPFAMVHYIKTDGISLTAACENYSKLLLEEQIDIVCMGIGENGHIAFNDPPFANFTDHVWVKVVALDEVSRQQQVNDGCFLKFEEVPKEAITLTIHALLSAKYLFIVVPGKTKANAVRSALFGAITEDCPASILRKHKNAKLYLDKDSSVNIQNENI